MLKIDNRSHLAQQRPVLNSRLSPEAKAARPGGVKRGFFVVFVVRVEMWEHRVWGPWTVYLISSFWEEFWPSFFGPLPQTFPDVFLVSKFSPCTNLQFLCNKPLRRPNGSARVRIQSLLFCLTAARQRSSLPVALTANFSPLSVQWRICTYKSKWMAKHDATRELRRPLYLEALWTAYATCRERKYSSAKKKFAGNAFCTTLYGQIFQCEVYLWCKDVNIHYIVRMANPGKIWLIRPETLDGGRNVTTHVALLPFTRADRHSGHWRVLQSNCTLFTCTCFSTILFPDWPSLLCLNLYVLFKD